MIHCFLSPSVVSCIPLHADKHVQRCSACFRVWKLNSNFKNWISNFEYCIQYSIRHSLRSFSRNPSQSFCRSRPWYHLYHQGKLPRRRRVTDWSGPLYNIVNGGQCLRQARWQSCDRWLITNDVYRGPQTNRNKTTSGSIPISMWAVIGIGSYKECHCLKERKYRRGYTVSSAPLHHNYKGAGQSVWDYYYIPICRLHIYVWMSPVWKYASEKVASPISSLSLSWNLPSSCMVPLRR